MTPPADPLRDEHLVVVDVEPDASGGVAPSSALAERLRTVLAQGYQVILLNVADLTYCDSVTLGAIVQAYASAMRAGATLRLIHVTGRLQELLRTTKLDRVLQSADVDRKVRPIRPAGRTPRSAGRRP